MLNNRTKKTAVFFVALALTAFAQASAFAGIDNQADINQNGNLNLAATDQAGPSNKDAITQTQTGEATNTDKVSQDASGNFSWQCRFLFPPDVRCSEAKDR